MEARYDSLALKIDNPRTWSAQACNLVIAANRDDFSSAHRQGFSHWLGGIHS
jgi:hypothetical protein